jgi:hypothetical protein
MGVLFPILDSARGRMSFLRESTLYHALDSHSCRCVIKLSMADVQRAPGARKRKSKRSEETVDDEVTT